MVPNTATMAISSVHKFSTVDQLHVAFERYQTSLSVVHLNIYSLRKNFDELVTLVERLQPDVIGLSETWLSSDDNSDHLILPGYRLYRRDGGGRGTGVACYVRSIIQCELINNAAFQAINDRGLNALVMRLSYGRTKFTFAVVYRSATRCTSNRFCEEFEHLLQACMTMSEQLFIVGDTNIDYLKADCYSRRLKDVISRYNFSQIIDRPTRETATSATLIDQVFVENLNMINFAAVLECDITDHYPLGLSLKSDDVSRQCPVSEISRRCLHSYDAQRFCMSLGWVPFHWIYDIVDLNGKAQLFHDLFIECLDAHAPSINMKMGGQRKRVRFKDVLLSHLVTAKDYYRWLFKQSGRHCYYNSFSFYRRAAKKRLKVLVAEETKAQICEAAGNPTKLWKYTKEAAGVCKVHDSVKLNP
jgi:exonuclease III